MLEPKTWQSACVITHCSYLCIMLFAANGGTSVEGCIWNLTVKCGLPVIYLLFIYGSL